MMRINTLSGNYLTFQQLAGKHTCLKTALLFFFLGGLQTCQPDRMHPEPDLPARFSLHYDSTWQIPEPGNRTSVSLALEMTNLGRNTIRFPLMDKFNISLTDQGGLRQTMEGGRDGIIDKDPYSDPIAPGETFLYPIDCYLAFASNGELQLIIRDGYGSIWRIAPLAAGSYLLFMEYKNIVTRKKDPHDLWTGSAKIDPVPIRILRN